MTRLSPLVTTGVPIEVSQKGVEYSSVMSSPLRGLAVGEAAYIIDSVVWISEEKFTVDPGYTHLILKVDAPEASDWLDDIVVNDYLAQPVTISPEASSRQFPNTSMDSVSTCCSHF